MSGKLSVVRLSMTAISRSVQATIAVILGPTLHGLAYFCVHTYTYSCCDNRQQALPTHVLSHSNTDTSYMYWG